MHVQHALELVSAFSDISGQTVPYQFTNRRDGDIASCYASADTALTLLGWEARLSITDMCRDVWRWQRLNPNGYKKDL